MIGALIQSVIQMGGAYGALRLRRLKARLLAGMLCLIFFLVFAVIALLFLFVAAFVELTESFGPLVAALILCGTACLICLCTVVGYLLSRRARQEASTGDLVSGLKGQLPSTLALGMALGRQTRSFSRSLLKPKNIALGVLLATVTAIASHPTSTYQLVKNILHRDVEKAERRHFWSRFIK